MERPKFLAQRWFSITAQAGAVLAVLWLVTAYQTRKHVQADTVPAFTLVDLEGRRVSLGDYRGKKVLLHFWATWCGVCRAELPSLRSLHRNLDEDEVLLTVVEDADDPEALRRFAREHELTYPILLGTDELVRSYGVGAFPTNYYLNGDGSVSSTSVGISTRLGMELRLFRASAN